VDGASLPQAHRFSRHPAEMIICRTLARYKGRRFNGSAAILIGRFFDGNAMKIPEENLMVDVRVICAIGKQGQLGLNGRLPWEGNPGTEYKADVQRFFALTRGHVVIAGPRTIAGQAEYLHGGSVDSQLSASETPFLYSTSRLISI
jgi:hypothetical protein